MDRQDSMRSARHDATVGTESSWIYYTPDHSAATTHHSNKRSQHKYTPDQLLITNTCKGTANCMYN
jgi:hypothetical protein